MADKSENKAKQKSLKIQAFTISCNNIKFAPGDLITLLQKKLHNSKVSTRKLKVSSMDTEEDLLAFYEITGIMLHGIMFRIDIDEKHNSLSNDLLDKNIIDLNDIDSHEVDNAFVVKNYFYFLIKDDKLITSYMHNRSIASFDTYINKLLKYEETGIIFSFTPMVIQNMDIPLSKIEYVEVGPPIKSKDQQSPEESKNSIFDITNIISNFEGFFNNVEAFNKIKDSEIISARILLKVSKPKGMKKEEYQRLLGTSLKPISDSDTESVSYKTKSGKIMTGKELLCKKDVTVNITEKGNIAENELFLEMNKFINELK